MPEKGNTPSWEYYAPDQEKYGVSDLYTLAELVKHRMLTPEDFQRLPAAYIAGFNSTFKRCFPKDAFDNLRALNIVADFIPPQEDMDLDAKWEEISSNLGIATPAAVTTEVAWKTFVKVQAKDFPDDRYEATAKELSDYIAEAVRRAHTQKDPGMLKRAIPAFKVLRYLHKMKEQTHYWCEDEFDAMARFGVDERRLDFRCLADFEALQAGEKFFNEASSVPAK